MGFSCCVVNCRKTSSNSDCKFYRFSTTGYKIKQKIQWINAVKRVNADGSTWVPKPYDRICSDHFVGGAKSDVEISPSYLPTLFPPAYKVKEINKNAAIERHNRFMQRRNIKEMSIMEALVNSEINRVKVLDNYEIVECVVENLDLFSQETHFNKTYVDQECQVNECQFSMESTAKHVDPEMTCMSNRFKTVIIDSATNDSTVINDVEIQTTIVIAKTVIIPSQKKMHDKECNTPIKVYVDSSVNVESQDVGVKRRSFHGYDTLRTEQDLLDLAGVHYDTFDFLLERVPVPGDNFKVSHEDRLLLLLIKLKTGLTFSSLSVMFDIHRTTVSRVVIYVLQYLASSTENLLFWPTKAQVQGTMPQCFYPDYNNTRVIIDCTEFRIGNPSDVDKKNLTFSHYKHGNTAKLLIGVTPGGFICLKSNVAGGRKSDSQMTIESGLIDLLEEGDVVLADKGFPEVRRLIDEQGRNVLVVLPPFLENKTEFSEDETIQTYKIARVLIHVERVIQRLRIYKILNEIPYSLFPYIDDLLHVICVLVNFQAPIHADEKNENTN